VTKDRRKPPSRIRYEESHPTISCRVAKEIYDRLQDIKKGEGRSFSDILKTGLGMLEAEAEKEDKAYSEGYKKGYKKAEQKFKVTYACSVCGKIMSLTSEEEKQAAGEYMKEQGWHYDECDEKRQ
jgi:predicted CopG family antitoxin